MKQEEALGHLREMIWALQRYRSITTETLGPGTGELYLSKKLAAEMWPWVFGKKCPLPVLMKMVDRGQIAPGDYYNMMTILDKFMSEVKLFALVQRGAPTIPEGPPSLDIFKGWEEE